MTTRKMAFNCIHLANSKGKTNTVSEKKVARR